MVRPQLGWIVSNDSHLDARGLLHTQVAGMIGHAQRVDAFKYGD